MAKKVWKKNKEAKDTAEKLAVIDMPTAPASEIYLAMQLQGLAPNGQPSLRSIERWVVNARAITKPVWKLWNEDNIWRGEDIRRVLLVLREVMRATEGRVRWFSEIEARRIAAIQTIVPLLPPLSVWHLARMYLLRERQDEDTRSIDEWLMFAIELGSDNESNGGSDTEQDDADTWRDLYDEVWTKGFYAVYPISIWISSTRDPTTQKQRRYRQWLREQSQSVEKHGC